MTATTTDRSEEIDRYLAGVTAALADLPGNLRQELLEDLPDHLAEIAADDPASLDSRLGSPPEYAAELRAAIGVDATEPKHRSEWWADLRSTLRPHVRAFDEEMGTLLGYDRLADLLVQLRPAWWIVRGYLVGMALLWLFANGYDVFPQDSNAGVLGWLLVLVLVGVSIRIGRQPLRLWQRVGPKWLAVGTVVIVFAAWSLTLLDGTHDDYYQPPSYGTSGDGDGSEVYVYTDEGQPITDVRVYGRNGGAVPIGVPMGCDKPDYGGYERRGCIPREDPASDVTTDGPTEDQTPSSEPSETVGPSGPSGSWGPSGSPSPSAS